MTAQRNLRPDGSWHFQHGPIDLILVADGDPSAVNLAHQVAWRRFASVLTELVAELPLLRSPVLPGASATHPNALNPLNPFQGVIAQRMWNACQPYHTAFITPMAAVAGAVAQEMIACYDQPGITRAWVNNGGDIALHLTPGQAVDVGLFADLSVLDAPLLHALNRGDSLDTQAQMHIDHASTVRGIATSGWRGRSFSLGIADSVTVLATTAAQADAAATVIANAVNIIAPGIEREPASDIQDNSDLGHIPVTVHVPRLPPELVSQALLAGFAKAQALQHADLIVFAALFCQGQWLKTDTVVRNASFQGHTPAARGSVLASTFAKASSHDRNTPHLHPR